MPWLICSTGDDHGLSVEIEEGRSYMMGRQEGCDILLLHQTVSRQHCRVHLKGSKLIIEDAGSSHWIKVDGKHVKRKVLKLKPGGHFEIGNDRFEYSESHDKYLEATEDVLDDLREHSEDEMLNSYAHMVADVSRKRKQQRKEKKSLLSRLFGL